MVVIALVVSMLRARARRKAHGFAIDDAELTFLKLFVLAQLVFLVLIVTNSYRGVPLRS